MPGVIIAGPHPQHHITVIVDPNAPIFSGFPKSLYRYQAKSLTGEILARQYLKPMGPNLAGWAIGKDPIARLQQLAQFPPSHWVHLQVPPLSDKVIHN